MFLLPERRMEKLNSNSLPTSGMIESDICECQYTVIGKIIFFDIRRGKSILKYGEKQKVGVIPSNLRPMHNLDFALIGNGREYNISFTDGAMYITPKSDTLPSNTPPYIYINICYLLN